MPEKDALKTVEAAISELDRPEVKDLDYAAMFEDSPTGIAFVHRDGTVLKVNPAFCGIIGYSSAELVRKRRTFELTHPDDVEADRLEASKVLAGESHGYQLTKRVLGKRGNVIWVTTFVTPVKDQQDVFIHFMEQTTQVPLSEAFYRIETNQDGAAQIRPFYPLAKLIKDNWKSLSVIFATLFGSIGTLGKNYLTMREDAIVYKQTIETQQKALDAQKVQLESVQRQLDRVAEKAGAE